jgi:RNA polymerase sigma-B factor
MAAADGLAPTSLDAPAHVGEAWTLNEIVGADDPGMELAECRVVLNEAIAELPARARDLLELRFGAELTQTEIAERLGTSQMSVSRSLASIVGKLRRAMLAQD